MSLGQIGLSNDGYDYSLVQWGTSREDRFEDEWCERELQKKERNGFQPSEKDSRQFDEVRRQIEADDSDVLPSPYLSMSGDFWPYDGDWEGAGRAIANNKYLNELYVGDYNSPDHEMNTNTEEQFTAFWGLVSDSTSITKLTLCNYSLLGGIEFFTLMAKLVGKQITNFRIEKADMNDEGATVLASILSQENVLETLKIEGGVSVEPWRIRRSTDPLTNEGWKSIVECLQSSHCKMTSLRISESTMDDKTASILANGLKNNPYLKTLAMNKCKGITNSGWQSIFSALETNSALDHLVLKRESSWLNSDPGLDEGVVTTLVNSLTNNHTLKSLNIMKLTEEGVRSFAAVLRSPHSVLEEFTCKDATIGFDTAIILANSLTGNTKMKKLVVKDYPPVGHHTEFAMVAEAFSRLVCNKSSIMATYESNHIFQDLLQDFGGRTLFKSILQVNVKSSSPAAAARSKIIKTHFSDVNVEEFVDMDEEVYPHAAAWMAKDMDGLSLLYKFLTSIPLDLDGSAVGAKFECDVASSKKKQKTASSEGLKP